MGHTLHNSKKNHSTRGSTDITNHQIEAPGVQTSGPVPVGRLGSMYHQKKKKKVSMVGAPTCFRHQVSPFPTTFRRFESLIVSHLPSSDLNTMGPILDQTNPPSLNFAKLPPILGCVLSDQRTPLILCPRTWSLDCLCASGRAAPKKHTS